MFVVHCFAFFLNYLDREERERRGVERVRVRERDREREPVALLCFSFWFLVTAIVLCLLLTMPWVGLQCVIVVFPDCHEFNLVPSPDFYGDWSWKKFTAILLSFRWFKKECCQLQAKVCAHKVLVSLNIFYFQQIANYSVQYIQFIRKLGLERKHKLKKFFSCDRVHCDIWYWLTAMSSLPRIFLLGGLTVPTWP